MTDIKTESYAPTGTSAASAIKAFRVDLPGITVWYSYSTAIAFSTDPDAPPVVLAGECSGTTERHKNWIDGGTTAVQHRVPDPEFQDRLNNALADVFTTELGPITGGAGHD